MASTNPDNWDTSRKTFADQFEQDGSSFIYRRSQKGEAIRVSADERSRFIDEFDGNLRRAKWMIYIGMALAFGGAILFSTLRGADLSQASMFVGVLITMIPYLAYIYWVWGAPARELAGRTPIAGERSPDEVRRLRFQRISYRQLGIAALGAAAVPFIGGARQSVFSGWNRLLLLFGGALLLFIAVQAFRKWRFERQESLSNVIVPSRNFAEPAEESGSSNVRFQLWRYLPFAVIVLGVGFIGYTSAGKQLASWPSFWPLLMIVFAAWSFWTVAQGFRTGQIEPFARGFYNTYQRETQPKRFWASMVWNAVFGGFFVVIAITMLWKASDQAAEDRCYNEHDTFPAQSAADACTQLINGSKPSGYSKKADALLYRGIAEERLNDRSAAIDDYSEAIRLQPSSYAYLSRGVLFLDAGKFDAAIADLSRAHDLNSKDVWPLANRGLAYAVMKDSVRAEADFDSVDSTDKTNAVVLRGRAVLSINSLNIAQAVGYLSASLKSQPDDLWSLRTRAWAYRQLGDYERADADIKRYETLSRRSAFVTVQH